MGIEYVKTMQGMINANTRFYNRLRTIQSRALQLGAERNTQISRELVEPHNFDKVLWSSIHDTKLNEFSYSVITSADHAYAIEHGVPPQGNTWIGNSGNWITFEEMPKLERWVKEKLMPIDSKKANFFLARKAVKVGHNGFPYGKPNGLRFMELGAVAGAGEVSLQLEKGLRSI